MIANPDILQIKYARIVKLFAEQSGLSYEEALGKFYDSHTYDLPHKNNRHHPQSMGSGDFF